VEEAESELRKVLWEKRSKELQIQREVIQAWERWNSARENLKLSESIVEEAQEFLRVANLRYDSGKSIYLENLDAIANLSRARLSRSQALFDLGRAEAELLRAMGRN
jgi:outer membrane protein TolC